ncbi:MAG TPA: hypothetical protein VNA25_10245 [Phycisphaerae bacterium]|nr:hypothetical protein [Phycisphaerae bacterium]
MNHVMRIGVFWIALAGLLTAGCEVVAPDDASVTAAQRVELAEKMRLVEQRHMPCQAEAVAAVLDEYLATEVRAVSAELVPIRNDGGLHWAWVVRIGGRTSAVLTAEPSGPAIRPTGGPAAKAMIRARRFIAEHFERSMPDRARGKDQPPIPPERLTGEWQERTHGVQIVAFELADPRQMRWKITAKPVGKRTLGGEIWMRFTPEALVSAEFGL